MERRNFLTVLIMLAVLAIVPCGINMAHAGPGGGTYYANSPAGGASGTALRKFVDSLPGVGAANANNLGQYIPVATPITGTPSVPADGDYYELGLVEYTEKMHSDLPKATKLRGYKDLAPSVVANPAHYLGPLIIAKKDRPVRIKFTNMLPTGTAGNLFIPTDTTLMGAGMGPLMADGVTPCDPTILGATCASYTQNRATIHLHGGNSPWISDGTPHQWITPAGEVTPYPKGVTVRSVPDMPAPANGEMNFFWTNQQSSRLMFYHDHSFGITRLNVYIGEAAGYLLTDQVEDDLIDGTNISGGNPGNLSVLPNLGGVYRYGIPLIIQDKTFVPQNIAVQDAKWTNPAWGTYGDLWFPHVYEPNQDPNSPDGANPFGRWDYGPWFWPPQPVAADKAVLPEPSTTPEAFHDTPLVNGTAYPYLTVQPRAYRFRILNACSDRFLNLQLYYSDPNDPSGKEVKMVPAAPNPAYPAGPYPAVAVWPSDGREGGVPDPALSGPKMIQIGSEGGFLPDPVVLPNQPINYDYDRRSVTVLNVLEKNLFLGAAERADVIIDFSSVPPGSTLILYNDSPAPVPAGDPRQDYFTGDPDRTANGGAPSTLRGYGPNMRTIMQFRVAGAASTPYNLASLQSALPTAFKASRPLPAVVPQPTYPVASGGNTPTELYSRIQDYSLTFTPVVTAANPTPLLTTIPFQPKAIQELWDPYGRMNATLGVELPFTSNLNQTTIPMGYTEPTTETTIDGQPQIWKITHNGVDTHPVHFHMVDVQVVNRVGWDGTIRPPDPNELGWKETIRMNPLEDIIVALQPKAQTFPFVLPTSIRPLAPHLPASAQIATTDFGNLGLGGTPVAGLAVNVPNVPVGNPQGYDFAYEFVWHCHILGHEENDFMRPFVFKTSTVLPPAPSGLVAYLGGQTVPGKTNYIVPYVNLNPNQITLQWTDNAPVSEPSSFRVERSSNNGTTWTPLTNISFLPGYPPIFDDKTVSSGVSYLYRVYSHNAIGDSATPALSASVTTGSWTAATGLTVTPSKPTPHVAGTNVTFTAAGSGATTTVAGTTVAYYYRFWLNSGAGPVLMQDYGSKNWWTLPAETPVGTYTIIVDVRTSSTPANVAGGYDFSVSVPYQIVPTPVPPATVVDKVPGIYAAAPVIVTLTATNSSSVPVGSPAPTIYYTTDGTIPTTATVTSFAGTGSITINATTTVNYFAVDVNGNTEAIHSDMWIVHPPVPPGDITSSAAINGGAIVTNSATVTLNLSAVDPAGVASMQFANGDAAGVCPTNAALWSVEEAYATTKAWTLDIASGNGLKTVCVRFRDKALPFSWTPPAAPVGGILYPPISASITYDSILPVTTASPIAGTYISGPISVTLTSNKPGTIYFTSDGTTPTFPLSGTTQIYTVPIPVTNIPGQSTTIKYFSIDTAGNAEAVKTGVWTIQSNVLVASVLINGGAALTKTPAVTLTLSATDPVGIATMQFSNDGVTYTAEEPYGTSKAWTLAAGDGAKTVYVRFRNTALPTGNLYDPVTANITLDTTPPVTIASPITGTYTNAPLVTLTANEPATIYYTTDGTTPTFPVTGTTQVYSNPIQLSASTTINYFAIDTAGNSETVKTGTWTVHVADLVASVIINGGAAITNNTTVDLTLSAVDAAGVSTMQFSNDGINYTTEEPYAVGKTWAIPAGDGVKTVYVRFRDAALGGGILYAPVTASITLDTTPPVTAAGPITGTYAVAPVIVTLTTNEPATIYYTLDGTTPTAASGVYTGPISLASTTTIKYFAVDVAGNVEPVKSGTWAIHASDLVASMKINNGAAETNSTSVILNLSAVDPVGVSTMQFSNDGLAYSAEEPYTTTKSWTLASGDGAKVVYVRFRDATLPSGNLYDPITATIILDTVAPVTTASPVSGTYANPPILVSLSVNEAGTIYYTIDGADPTTGSAVYSGPISIGVTTTLKYRAVDAAGNMEAVKSGVWTIHAEDLVASVKINNGASWTNNASVTLTLSAEDPLGLATMQFSNDGINFTPEEPYATSKAWILTPGEGIKTVYVRFRDKALGGGNLYSPVFASIAYGNKDGILPGTSSLIGSAVKALKIANKMVVATELDLVHGDVAPHFNGGAHPDGKIDVLDVSSILLFQVGLISSF